LTLQVDFKGLKAASNELVK